MIRILPLLALAAASALAQQTWFTVTGNPQDAQVNTIEVDPIPVSVSGEQRTMRVRVSRSNQRINWEGLPYRSYVAQVQIDCDKKTARYQSITFYMRPLWAGAPHNTTDYTRGPVRWMEFRQVDPNPVTRILRAACRAG